MVIVIGGFDEGSGEHGEMPLPETGSVYRIDRDPSVIGSIQPQRAGGQDKVRSQRSLAQQAHSVRGDWLGNASEIGRAQFIDHSAERSAERGITNGRHRRAGGEVYIPST